MLTTITELATQSVEAGGIIDTANSTNTALQDLIKNFAVTVVIVMVLWIGYKKGFAFGALLGIGIVGGIILFLVNGGLSLLGVQIGTDISNMSS